MANAIVRISPQEAQRRLSDVPEDKGFWSHDGKIFSNLAGLAQGLGEMAAETFAYHAPADHNDFAKWVGEVIGDATLAHALSQSHTPAAAASAVRSRVKWLQAKSSPS